MFPAEFADKSAPVQLLFRTSDTVEPSAPRAFTGRALIRKFTPQTQLSLFRNLLRNNPLSAA